PTINGQSTIKGYEKTLEVLSFSHSVSIATSPGMTNAERTGGKPNFSDLSFSRYTDSATPQLMQACAGGTVLDGDTILTVARNDESGAVLPMVVFTLKDVVISMVSTSGGGDLPMESVSLTYSHIKVDYHVQKIAGGLEGVTPFVFNVATNEPA
ncbi:MAG: type VI secretion system tube protein Hcp, partial [Comamonadaceae bacterium]